MTWFLRFASSRLGIGVLTGLAALLIIGAIVLAKNGEIRAHERTIRNLAQRVVNLQSDLTQCRANRAALERGIASQSAAIEAMRREGEVREAELGRVAERASQAARSADARARQIMGRRSTGDQCQDAAALIRETVQ